MTNTEIENKMLDYITERIQHPGWQDEARAFIAAHSPAPATHPRLPVAPRWEDGTNYRGKIIREIRMRVPDGEAGFGYLATCKYRFTVHEEENWNKINTPEFEFTEEYNFNDLLTILNALKFSAQEIGEMFWRMFKDEALNVWDVVNNRRGRFDGINYYVEPM